MDYQRISWETLVTSCQQLARKLPIQSIDEIIAVSRGGLVFARLLADYLTLPLSTVGIASYQGKVQVTEPRIIQPLGGDYAHKNLLLVDDVSDSGKTFLIGKKYLKSIGAEQIFTASPFVKSQTTLYPDYWNEIINKWIIFPYEIHENFIELKQEHGQQKAKELLLNLGIEEWEFYE